MSKIPTPVIVCITAAFLGVIITLGWLSAVDADATEIRSFINLVMNLAGLLLGGGALTYAGLAARQTNGDLDKRIEAGARAALDQADADNRKGTR